MKKWLIACVALILALSGCSASAPIEYMTAEESDYTVTLQCFGTLESTSEFAPTLAKGGTVMRWLVEKGDRVNTGDALAEVYINGREGELKSELSGVVAQLNLAAGEESDGKSKAVSVLGTEGVRLKVNLSEADMLLVSVGDEVSVSGDGFEKEAYAGRVAKVYSLAAKKSGNVLIEATVTLDETDDSVIPGLSARALISSHGAAKAVVLPQSAVGYDSEGYYAYCGTEKRRLESARACDGGYAVKGIEQGERVAKSVDEVEKNA